MHNKLSPRELEVCTLIAAHYSHKMIAEKLGIETQSVKSYVLRAYNKTNTWNHKELVEALFNVTISLRKDGQDGTST